MSEASNKRARVIKSTGSWYTVEDENGKIWQCRLRGKFKIKNLKVTNPIAVGDWVHLEPEDDERAIITEIEERHNYIIRKSSRNQHQGHIIAANIDQAVLIATLKMPRTSLGFIDRFLVTAEAYRIPAAIIINKRDLLQEKGVQFAEQLFKIYEPLGYKCRLVSAHSEEDIRLLQQFFQGKLSVLSGHSGVGKSTLLNNLYPEARQKTNEVSTFANKGTHTTTFAEMFRLNSSTYIIDTPGIKELALQEMEEDPLDHYFPEMRELLGECRFNNCSHTHEPGCAVINAVEEAKIAFSRYESYLSMLQGEESHR
jgi:ribosome biogenesis GTPase